MGKFTSDLQRLRSELEKAKRKLNVASTTEDNHGVLVEEKVKMHVDRLRPLPPTRASDASICRVSTNVSGLAESKSFFQQEEDPACKHDSVQKLLDEVQMLNETRSQLQARLAKEMEERNKYEELMQEELHRLLQTVSQMERQNNDLTRELQQVKDQHRIRSEGHEFPPATSPNQKYASPPYAEKITTGMHAPYTPSDVVRTSNHGTPRYGNSSPNPEVMTDLFQVQLKLAETIKDLDHSLKKRDAIFDSLEQDQTIDLTLHDSMCQVNESISCHSFLDEPITMQTSPAYNECTTFNAKTTPSTTRKHYNNLFTSPVESLPQSHSNHSQASSPTPANNCDTPSEDVESSSYLDFKRFRETLRLSMSQSTTHHTAPEQLSKKQTNSNVDAKLNEVSPRPLLEHTPHDSVPFVDTNASPRNVVSDIDVSDEYFVGCSEAEIWEIRGRLCLEVQDKSTELTLLQVETAGKTPSDDVSNRLEKLRNDVLHCRRSIQKLDGILKLRGSTIKT